MPNMLSRILSSLTGLSVWAVDDYGTTRQDGGVGLKSNPSPVSTETGYVQLYSPDGESLWTQDAAGVKTVVSSGSGTGGSGALNVKSFGAIGNGVHDDTAAIQTALNIANLRGGGVVYLPAGTYKLSSALTLYSNITMYGDGVALSVLQQTSTSAHGLVGSNLELVTLQDFTVDGPATGTGVGIRLTGTVVIYSFYINMTRVMVKQFGSHGILIDDPVTSVLTNVTSKENGGEGFYIQCSDLGTVGTSTSLIGCYAHNNTSGNGFRLYNMVYSALSGCATDNNTNGYKIEACEGVTLTGCGAEENTGDSIQVNGGNNISVWGAWLSESGTNGVHVTGSAHQVTLKGIKEFSSGSATFIKVDAGCTEVTIENCKSDTLTNSLAVGTTTVLPANSPTPADVDLIGWTYDGAIHTAGSGSLVDGTIYLAAVYIREVTTATQLWYAVTTASSAATAASNWIGLYNASGTRLATVDITTDIGTTGIKTATFTGITLTPGMYWIAILSNGTGTDPQVSVANNAGVATVKVGMPNGNLPAARLRYATNATAQTTLPSTITPGSNTSTGALIFWGAVG